LAQGIVKAILGALPRAYEAILVGHGVLQGVEQVCESIPGHTQKIKAFARLATTELDAALTQKAAHATIGQRHIPKEKTPMSVHVSQHPLSSTN
jgi:hypothetical protein